jgi:uncharacterized membrane protein YuzA (DUF378 family)
MTNRILYYAAAATTAIAGILHLSLVPDIIGRNLNSGVFFLISGIAQVFWLIPMLKRWGRIWYYIGIAGTIVLIIAKESKSSISQTIKDERLNK